MLLPLLAPAAAAADGGSGEGSGGGGGGCGAAAAYTSGVPAAAVTGLGAILDALAALAATSRGALAGGEGAGGATLVAALRPYLFGPSGEGGGAVEGRVDRGAAATAAAGPTATAAAAAARRRRAARAVVAAAGAGPAADAVWLALCRAAPRGWGTPVGGAGGDAAPWVPHPSLRGVRLA